MTSQERNDRRCELIDKEIEDTILPAEKRELEELQKQMLTYRRKVAPLPLKEAQRLHQHLLKKAAEKASEEPGELQPIPVSEEEVS